MGLGNVLAFWFTCWSYWDSVFGPESVLRLLGSRGILGFCGKGRSFSPWGFPFSLPFELVTGGLHLNVIRLLLNVGVDLHLLFNDCVFRIIACVE